MSGASVEVVLELVLQLPKTRGLGRADGSDSKRVDISVVNRTAKLGPTNSYSSRYPKFNPHLDPGADDDAEPHLPQLGQGPSVSSRASFPISGW
jgi:hypothetical protein